MQLIQSKKFESNYWAKIVNITSFNTHPNQEVTKLKVAHVDGYNIIVGIDETPGLYIYFPMMSEINPSILSYCNLYDNPALNKDETKKGFFSKNGKVKGIKLKGLVSEGFLLPANILYNFIVESFQKYPDNFKEGVEFDSIKEGDKIMWISRKYKVEYHNTKVPSTATPTKQVKGFDKIREDQFKFHYDTTIIKKVPEIITPDSILHISSKWHGTSGISAYVLCHKKLSWKEKIAKWLTGESFDTYDYVYSSRKVIKNKYYNKKVDGGFYGSDPWYYTNEILKPILKKGMTIYYEIVGYTPDGKEIQKGYDYGCTPSTTEYVINKQFKIYVYRITTTNVNGDVFEMTPLQVIDWCKRREIGCINTLYYGKAKDLYSLDGLSDIDTFSDWFLEKLANDTNFYMEQNSPDCINKVPHEGIVIKKEGLWSNAFKLKCFAFLNKEQKDLDKGITNIEDEQ